MTLRTLLLLALLVLLSPPSVAPANLAETEHLIVEWVDGTPPEAIEAAKATGERYYAVLRDKLGHGPDAKVTILLEGQGRPDGSRGYPRVDQFGQIHLLQFGPTWESYFESLVHEMVHAFRFRRRVDADWFFEEGFAEFVALRVDPALSGFPWFGFSVTVAAGQWIVRGESIALAILREKHRSINLPCMAQSYTLRADFFRYLAAEHGEDAVLGVAAEEGSGMLSHYQRHFGASLSTLETRWRVDLRRRYRLLADADDKARRYREETPIKYMPVCSNEKVEP